MGVNKRNIVVEKTRRLKQSVAWSKTAYCVTKISRVPPDVDFLLSALPRSDIGLCVSLRLSFGFSEHVEMVFEDCFHVSLHFRSGFLLGGQKFLPFRLKVGSELGALFRCAVFKLDPQFFLEFQKGTSGLSHRFQRLLDLRGD
jgi:hypothetical protein